jgi:hypothetical protein
MSSGANLIILQSSDLRVDVERHLMKMEETRIGAIVGADADRKQCRQVAGKILINILGF